MGDTTDDTRQARHATPTGATVLALWQSRDAICEALGISSRTLQRRVRNGEIERVQVGREGRYRVVSEPATRRATPTPSATPDERHATRDTGDTRHGDALTIALRLLEQAHKERDDARAAERDAVELAEVYAAEADALRLAAARNAMVGLLRERAWQRWADQTIADANAMMRSLIDQTNQRILEERAARAAARDEARRARSRLDAHAQRTRAISRFAREHLGPKFSEELDAHLEALRSDGAG